MNLVPRRGDDRIAILAEKNECNCAEQFQRFIGRDVRPSGGPSQGALFQPVDAQQAVYVFYSLIGRRSCSSTLTSNPLLDEERAVDDFYTLGFTLNQKSNAGSIQKGDILQVEFWRPCALFNFCPQLRQMHFLNPAAQLKNCFTQKLLDA